MWFSLQSFKLSDDVFGLRRAFLRRTVMMSSAAAWYWLEEYCRSSCRALVQQLRSAADPDAVGRAASVNAVLHLCWRVYVAVAERQAVDYQACDFFPHLKDASLVARVERPRILEEDYTDRVCDNVVAMLRQWLDFPNNTEKLAGYFVMYLVGSLKNSDVLLLDGVWSAYRSVGASLVGTNKKAKNLRVSDLRPFALALTQLPLCDPTSKSSALMQKISCTIEHCGPGLRAATNSFVQFILAQSLDARSSHFSSHPSHHASSSNCQGSSSSFPSPSLSSTTSCEAGLQSLTEFALEMLPLACQTPLPHPTKLQRRALDNPDRFLPFRECAPSRQRVAGPGGPFHPNQRDLPGAFPSWVIFRALLFDSRAVLEGDTPCYFSDHSAWLEFLATEGYDSDDQGSVDRIFNIRCYGSAQNQRREGKDLATHYFDAVPRWEDLVQKHQGNPIPFTEFFWTQGKVLASTPTPRRQFQSIPKLPLVGKLTGYLLAVDLCYAGKVATPSLEEVARIIRYNELGSLSGLFRAGLLSSTKQASEADVIVAFSTVFHHLRRAIPAQHHQTIAFDAIMVEHLLCKYQRCKGRKKST